MFTDCFGKEIVQGEDVIVSRGRNRLHCGIAVGTNVRRGQKIGWTGATGNAYNVKHKHLHLETIVNGKYVNPEKYINGTINKETGAIVVKCDSEYQNTSEDNPGTLWDNAILYW